MYILSKKLLFILVIFILIFSWGNFSFNLKSKIHNCSFAQISNKILGGQTVYAAGSATINATIKITVCGNGVKEIGEQCDGADLGGETCASLGFRGGTLSCGASCDFNTSACISGNSGGGGGIYMPPTTGVIFSGRAYPLSKVTVLKDGQVAATTIAGPDANFYVLLSGLSSGNYMFSTFGEDSNKKRSTLFTFPIFITQGATTQVSGIFIAPTIDVDKSEVKRGDNIAIFGQSAPGSEVTVAVNSDNESFTKTQADKNGVYLYNFDTSSLEIGSHSAKSKASLDGQVSPYGKSVSFAVGGKTIGSEKKCGIADINCDGKVNLVDFSILLYWWEKPNVSADFNADGIVDLADFSIMLYYWTG